MKKERWGTYTTFFNFDKSILVNGTTYPVFSDSLKGF